MTGRTDGCESELVAQAAAGDRAATQRLLTRDHARLVTLIGDKIPADLQGVLSAEDICQEAYVTVISQIASLREHRAAAFRSWLQAIVERKLIDAIRALRAQKRGGGRRVETGGAVADVSSVAELLDIVAVHRHTPSRSVQCRELAAGMREALDDLQDTHREALRLHYLEGLSVSETADRMGRSAKAVVMLCNRGLKQLAARLGDPADFLTRDA